MIFSFKKKHIENQAGFTLVETALIVLVLGLFMGAVLALMPAEDDAYAISVTQQRQKRIATALSDFAVKYGYLPCPAYVSESNNVLFGLTSEFWRTGATAPCLAPDDRIGIVPYRMLGLSFQDVHDGYGNLMTYLVTDEATNIRWNASNNMSVPVVDNEISEKCRVDGLWIDSGTNRNERKARFCCRNYDHMAQERKIIWGITAGSGDQWVERIENVGPIDPINTAVPFGIFPHTRGAYYAYVLRSHGKNGHGAFLYRGDGATNRIQLTGEELMGADPLATGANEIHIGYYHPDKGSNYYDDITLWRTQEQTIAETGRTNCAVPF